MYIPPAFAQTDPAVVTGFLHEHSFALLVSGQGGALAASHLPLLYEPCPAGAGVLYGHFARANRHWQEAQGEVLAIFSGPHAYVSPSWYESEHVVPTWNYAAVHVAGRLTIVEDADESLAILGRLVEFYEEGMPRPWSFDPKDDWSRRLVAGIVAFRVDITSIEAKWKLSQNQPLERRLKVIDALEGRGRDESLAVAAMMRQALPPDPSTR
jgi:transcriptional regulator